MCLGFLVSFNLLPLFSIKTGALSYSKSFFFRFLTSTETPVSNAYKNVFNYAASATNYM
jgi:hypothetical protein